MGHNPTSDSPSSPSNAISDSAAEKIAVRQRRFIDEARSFWTKQAKVEINSQDAQEIITNLTGFFDVLFAWSTREEETENGGSGRREERPCS